MKPLKTPNTKIVVDYLSFLSVTQMVTTNVRFDRYGFWKTGHGAELFWTDWAMKRNLRFKGLRWVKLCEALLRILQLTFSTFKRLLKHMILATAATVTAIRRWHSCGVLADRMEIWFFDGLNSGMGLEMMKIMIFKIVILLDGLSSLMICTHDLIILIKTKETISYCE
jgi:hypothetical protein